MIPPEDIKPREIEILRLMAAGLTNREIAERLYIGVETVRWYAKQIYDKLAVSGREEAAQKAQELGWLDEDKSAKDPHQTKPKHNLPTQLTWFIGREKQLTETIKLLAERRLLTLTGPGGTGKTRLSLKVAETMVDNFPDGVYFVDLAPVGDSTMVVSAITQTLGVIEVENEPILAVLKQAIGNRSLLLVLDNFEHVIEAASIVADLLLTAPNLKVVVTSREVLRVTGEQVYSVPPMTLPENGSDDIEAVLTHDAIALFVQQACAAKIRFRLKPDDVNDVVEICRRLDGMPLAIELAASLCRFLTPSAILARMDNRFQTLTSGSRNAPERQQTLRKTIDWSYNLLEEGQKIFFARLAVFRGGRSLEAIEAICGQNLSIDVFDGLAALVDKSLIRQIEDMNGNPRFVMLETIREYARERLTHNSEVETVRQRHAGYFVNFLANRLDDLKRSRQIQVADEIAIEWDNVAEATSSAWVWHPENFDRVRDAIEAIYLFTEIKDRLGDMRTILELVRERLAPDVINETNPAWQMVTLRFLLPIDYQLRLAKVEAILTLVTARNDLAEIALCCLEQGVCFTNLSDNREQAFTLSQKAYQLYEELGDDYGRAESLSSLASASWHRPDKAIDFSIQALQIAEQLDNPWLIININSELAITYAYGKGDNFTAEQHLKQALELAKKIGAGHEVIRCQVTLGWMAVNSGNLDQGRSYAQVCMKSNQALYSDYGRWHPYIQMAIIKSVVDEEYETGLRLTQQAHEGVISADGFAVSSWGMSIPLIGMGRYQEAVPYVRRWLDWATGMRQVGAIASFALILGSTGRHEWCTELLGFCENNSMAGWKDNWSVTHTIIQQAKAELGGEGYQAAFERGKSLNLETVVQDLWAEFGNM